MTEDPYVQIERLHGEWSELTEEIERIMRDWSREWPDPAQKDLYYAKQEAAQKLVQKIMEIKREQGW